MLRIAQIGSIWETTPPTGYGGTERVQSALTEGLVKRGHAVTLFAAGTSKTSAKLVSVYPHPLYRDNIPWTNLMYPLLHISEAFDREQEFDLIHMHLNKSSDYLSLPLAQKIPHKVLFTLHFPYPLSQGRLDRHAVLYKYRNLQFVSISQAARYQGEGLNWIATVYNGIDLTKLRYTPRPLGNHFVWLGKFNPDKGAHLAIEACHKAKKKLVLAGKVDKLEKEDYLYFKKKVEPYIDNDQITYVGEVGGKKKSDILGGATGFLNPIRWNEPFGLVMAESMACGTPVISFKRGAAPELIKDGKTGFLVTSLEGMVEAMGKVHTLSRPSCRSHVETHFSSHQMVNSYERVYRSLLSRL